MHNSDGETVLTDGHQCLWVVDDSSVIRPAALVGAVATLVAGLSDDKAGDKRRSI